VPVNDATPAGPAGSAYLVVPDDGPGHGVLVLHSWWGLTRGAKDLVESLADAGYTALAPDLLGGHLPVDADEARDLLAATDPNETAALVLSSIVALRAHCADTDGPVAVLGFSMGASWALWVATRQPASVDAVVAYYGSQNIDFQALQAPVMGHFAEFDPLVSEDELVEMQAHLLLLDKHVEFHRYPGTSHWFAELERDAFTDDTSAEVAARARELAAGRTMAFLAEHAPPRA
jgi:carboxymethylenebutenolidase